MRSLVPLVAVLVLCGCPPAGVRGTARTLPRGETRLYAFAAPLITTAPAVNELGEPSRAIELQAVYDVGLSHGLLENLEAGFGLSSGGEPYLPGLHASLRARLLSPEVWPLPVHVTLAPMVTLPTAYLDVPLLVGIDLPGAHELVLAPKVSWRLRLDATDLLLPAFVGGSVGYAIRLPAQGMMVKPEVSVLYALRTVSALFIATPYEIAAPGDFRLALGVELSTLPREKR